MAAFVTQLRSSRIPFPQRRQLEIEIGQDLQDVPAETAELDAEDLAALENIHSTPIFKWLDRIGPKRKYVDSFVAFVPSTMTLTILIKEDAMMGFIQEGGAGMYALIVIGLVLLAREVKNVFRLIVVKDHSKDSLRLDTPSVLVGSFALLLLGIGWSALGIYYSANYVIAKNESYQVLLIGVKESLAPMILSATLAGIVVLTHYGTRRVMHVWNASLAD